MKLIILDLRHVTITHGQLSDIIMVLFGVEKYTHLRVVDIAVKFSIFVSRYETVDVQLVSVRSI